MTDWSTWFDKQEKDLTVELEELKNVYFGWCRHGKSSEFSHFVGHILLLLFSRMMKPEGHLLGDL